MPLVLYPKSDHQTQGRLYFSYLSSRGFINCCEGTKSVSKKKKKNFFFACGCALDLAPFVEKTVCFTVLPLLFCHRLVDSFYMGPFLDSSL